MAMTCVALSFERTFWSLKLDMADGTLREPPKRSQCRSCAIENLSGPPSQAMAPDHTWGWRVGVSVSSVEYCSAPLKPAKSGVSYCTAFCRRRWKLEAEFVP